MRGGRSFFSGFAFSLEDWHDPALIAIADEDVQLSAEVPG